MVVTNSMEDSGHAGAGLMDPCFPHRAVSRCSCRQSEGRAVMMHTHRNNDTKWRGSNVASTVEVENF